MRKMKNATKTMVYLDEPEHRALRQISEKTGMPMAEQIRQAVARYLKAREKAVRR